MSNKKKWKIKIVKKKQRNTKIEKIKKITNNVTHGKIFDLRFEVIEQNLVLTNGRMIFILFGNDKMNF